ncbi:hypothetical protein FACS189413_01610 [Bacteroidia bacterium]|nr:hypothetical protein FACS189463_0380 [Bacteroidia bacterium]GHU67227.1 hypothetical protein FACS189413_01610 [Bacteroidia bacterium]
MPAIWDKALTPQGYREPSFIMNIGARYSLFDNKAYFGQSAKKHKEATLKYDEQL